MNEEYVNVVSNAICHERKFKSFAPHILHVVETTIINVKVDEEEETNAPQSDGVGGEKNMNYI